MIARYVAAVIAATWLLWQIPFSHSESVIIPEVFATTQLAGLAETEGNPALFFYRNRRQWHRTVCQRHFCTQLEFPRLLRQ